MLKGKNLIESEKKKGQKYKCREEMYFIRPIKLMEES
jgi:hypothetical protein